MLFDTGMRGWKEEIYGWSGGGGDGGKRKKVGGGGGGGSTVMNDGEADLLKQVIF